ncbi:MAG: 30S ribosomal protein S2 [Candidatus Aenigmarchaeota archaeon]|nr:30S ribosomal protein S2 [Candidatus Aenigmarchaeota archaeon]MCK5299940.1 30S ribosomal protein S2 [Candidatus Aenigmarchaeota archaeon]MCK5321788.1 30S ribosomal protein S2 [Candidatus Aenigmarchaeota archaeon]
MTIETEKDNLSAEIIEDDDNMLVARSVYLSAGLHIGMKQKVKSMEKYIYKIRSDKLAVFNIQMVDQQIRDAAKMISRYAPEDILVVSRKTNGHKPVVMFAKAIGGAKVIYGRFYPGTLTNPAYEKFIEPKLVIVTDSNVDQQVIKESFSSNIPIIGICDTFNDPKYIDFVISANNKGRKSLSLIYWLLAREVLKVKEEIKGDAEFKYTEEDFVMPVSASNLA